MRYNLSGVLLAVEMNYMSYKRIFFQINYNIPYLCDPRVIYYFENTCKAKFLKSLHEKHKTVNKQTTTTTNNKWLNTKRNP